MHITQFITFAVTYKNGCNFSQYLFLLILINIPIGYNLQKSPLPFKELMALSFIYQPMNPSHLKNWNTVRPQFNYISPNIKKVKFQLTLDIDE